MTQIMKRTRTLLLAILGVALVSGPALAHHSAAMFDFTKRQELEGVVKDIRVINPHMSITLVVADAKGTRDIAFEGHSVNNFYRAGWRPNMVKVGDKIKVMYAPRKDALEGGYVTGFVTAQGREIGFRLPGESASAAAEQGSSRSAN